MKLFFMVKRIYQILALAFVPCTLTVLLHIYNSGPWWELSMVLLPLVVLIYVMPFYLLYLELGAAVGRLRDGKLRSHGERRLGYATTAVAVLLAMGTVGTALMEPPIGVPELILQGGYVLAYLALPTLWAVGAGVYKKRPPIKDWLQNKSILIPALVLFLLALSLGIIALCLNLSGGFHPGGKPDPLT